MALDIIVGTQWGDEGKGRVVDLLASGADYVARFNGGDNAGHTVTVGEETFKLHLIPSGIIQPGTVALIGNGLVVNPEVLLREIKMLRDSGITVNPDRLILSYAAHLITPAHHALDAAREQARGKAKIGTTLRGIGPAYNHKAARSGLRVEDLLDYLRLQSKVESHVQSVNNVLTRVYNHQPLNIEKIKASFLEYAEEIKPYIGDVSRFINAGLKSGKTVIAEGAQGTLLDLDHGTYPYVTSSHPTAPGALIGLGVGVGCVGSVVGVTKAFQTRVGEGPFPTEITGKDAVLLRGTGENPWDEFGTTTGRPRRVGWFDGVLLRYAIRVNGISQLAITKLDILSGFKNIKICTDYIHQGKVVPDLVQGPADLSPYEPVFEDLPGWDDNIMDVRHWEDLPANARAYILRIEEISSVPVRLVSVGPERDQIIRL